MPDQEKKAPQPLLRPFRTADYEIKTVTGFVLRPLGQDSFLLDAFVDLPPLGPAKNPETGEDAFVIERRHIFGVAMDRDQAKNFAERILDAVSRQEPEKA